MKASILKRKGESNTLKQINRSFCTSVCTKFVWQLTVNKEDYYSTKEVKMGCSKVFSGWITLLCGFYPFCVFFLDTEIWILRRPRNHWAAQVYQRKGSKCLTALEDHFLEWRLKLSVIKTEFCCFPFNSKMSTTTLNVYFDGTLLQYNQTPKYLEDSLIPTLSFKKHLMNTARKI